MEEEEGILHKSCPIGNGGSSPPIIAKHCGIVQRSAFLAHNQFEVGGSNPSPATNTLRISVMVKRGAHNPKTVIALSRFESWVRYKYI